MSDNTGSAAAADIEQWLRATVADFVQRPAADIQPDVPLSEYGLTSVYVLGLCAEIEDRYAVKVEAAIVWDHPTLGGLSAALVPVIAAG